MGMIVVFVALAFFFLILIPLVLAILIPIFKDHHKATGKVVNYDPAMRRYVYRVCLSEEEIIRKLGEKRSTDDLSCAFDVDRRVVDVSEYGSHREYFYDVQVCDGYSILRLEQVATMGMQSHIPYKLNPFVVRKLQAEIIPFSQYGF